MYLWRNLIQRVIDRTIILRVYQEQFLRGFGVVALSVVLLALKDKNFNYNYRSACLKCWICKIFFYPLYSFSWSHHGYPLTHMTWMSKRKLKQPPKKQIHCYNCTCLIFYQRPSISKVLWDARMYAFSDGNPRRSLSFCKHPLKKN